MDCVCSDGNLGIVVSSTQGLGVVSRHTSHFLSAFHHYLVACYFQLAIRFMRSISLVPRPIPQIGPEFKKSACKKKKKGSCSFLVCVCVCVRVCLCVCV
jgi:hypothetical protein